jgi:hypothetical protein
MNLGRDYCDTRTVADRTGLSVSFFNQSRLRGDGPPYRKVGRRVLYAWQDVERWMDARARHSTSEVAGSTS